jgi:hypothetical protein
MISLVLFGCCLGAVLHLRDCKPRLRSLLLYQKHVVPEDIYCLHCPKGFFPT